jgi:hypothetical protein
MRIEALMKPFSPKSYSEIAMNTNLFAGETKKALHMIARDAKQN